MNDNQLHILLVESQPSDAELTEQELLNKGILFTSLRVETKETFLKALKEFQPDLIISDYAMPEFNGMEALKLSLEHDPQLPFIILTGSKNEETAVDCMKTGAMDYIIKSRMTRLPSAVREAIDKQRMLREKQEAEAKYRRLYESMMDAFVSVDMNGRIQEFNGEYARMLGYEPEEIQTLTDEDITPQRWQANDAKIVAEQILSRGYSVVYEKEYRRKDGTVFPVELRTFRLTGADRQPRGMWSIVRDITERKTAEAALLARNEEIRIMSRQLWQTAKLATMGELSASIAHELNNPLAIISLRIESLTVQTPEGDPHRRELAIIGEEVERMGNLVTNLLQFGCRSRQQISMVDVSQEIEKTLELLDSHFLTKSIIVVRQFTPGVPEIPADRQQLRQLFLNLFMNASDAMSRGGTLTIHVTRIQETRDVCIEIADTGTGIRPEILPTVMEPFHTTKPEGKGTGLGLAICRRIAQDHRGTLTITSEGIPGRGTNIRITLPSTNQGDSSHSVNLRDHEGERGNR